jgi:dTDP-3-amino-3,4,6-trideoxy-alpha-D-glucose transaminase
VAADVAYLSFRGAPPQLRAAWQDAMARVVDSGIFVGGPEVRAFEDAFADHCGIDHCVGVGNGLDALALALRSAGIGPGHRVAVPGHTFIATWLAVLAAGAEPVGVDVDAQGLIDIAALADLTPVPDAVIPVHLHGQLVDMPRLTAWADPLGVVVVEDTAQAHGATGDGWRPGSLTHAAAYSFYPSKNLGALGDAGGIVTRDDALAARARELRNYGAHEADKYAHRSLGVNSRLDPLQAAVLRVNLAHLDAWNATRRSIAAAYLDALGAGSPAVRPLVASPEASVWHHFVVVADDRDAVRAHLAQEGIGTDVHYPRMAGQEIADLTGAPGPDLPRSAELARTVLSLPLHPWLTAAEVDRVAAALARLAGAGPASGA